MSQIRNLNHCEAGQMAAPDTAVERDAQEIPERFQTEDNWEHRSLGMLCSTCMWYVPKKDGLQGLQEQPKGRCRKRSPTMDGFPVVFPSDWCGSHKLK